MSAKTVVPLDIITSCAGCGGACCRNQPSPQGFQFVATGHTDHAWPDDVDILSQAPPEVLDSIRSYFAERMRLNDWNDADGKPCFWLTEDGRCRHYEYRPTICRDFELGSNACRKMRSEATKPTTGCSE